LPVCWPDSDELRREFAEFYGAITIADAAVGQLLDVLADTGLDANTWVVFLTDHGPAFPGAMSTLYDAGTGIALIVRPPRGSGVTPRVYDELFSGVDLLPTLLGLVGIDQPGDIDGKSHAHNLLASSLEISPVRGEIFSSKSYLDSFDRARAIRTKDYSYLETYHHRSSPAVSLDFQTGSSVRVMAPQVGLPQPDRELYDLVRDPGETRNLLATPGFAFESGLSLLPVQWYWCHREDPMHELRPEARLQPPFWQARRLAQTLERRSYPC